VIRWHGFALQMAFQGFSIEKVHRPAIENGIASFRRLRAIRDGGILR
jgi:hypothetical protein